MLYVATRFRTCSLCVNRKYRPILCVSIYTYNCMVSKDHVSEEHDILMGARRGGGKRGHLPPPWKFKNMGPPQE